MRNISIRNVWFISSIRITQFIYTCIFKVILYFILVRKSPAILQEVIRKGKKKLYKDRSDNKSFSSITTFMLRKL